jgi:hypothetical protein
MGVTWVGLKFFNRGVISSQSFYWTLQIWVAPASSFVEFSSSPTLPTSAMGTLHWVLRRHSWYPLDNFVRGRRSWLRDKVRRRTMGQSGMDRIVSSLGQASGVSCRHDPIARRVTPAHQGNGLAHDGFVSCRPDMGIGELNYRQKGETVFKWHEREHNFFI